ncbi:MAG TPA: hypothetical protein VN285_01755 [Candidatus Deferrimicrobium sp.]|nr:hypothetical protein [Candidatus Deferrimicrobium sp.]
MRKFASTLLAVSATAVVLVTAQPSSSLPPPTNIRITNHPLLHNEEQVFICPTDSNIIIANWRDFRLGYRQVGIGRSTDAGQTWFDSLIPPEMQYFGFDAWQSDPTMTVHQSGTYYMSILDFVNGSDNQSVIAFYKSTNKGVSWTGPVAHVPPGLFFEDKQFITADRTGGPYDGNLYCSWTRFENPDRIMFIRSTDGGASFDDTVIVGPTQTSTGCGSYIVDAGQFSIPIVSSNGDVHVFWLGIALDSGLACTGDDVIKHVVSTDGGQTFTDEDVILSVSGWGYARGGVNIYSQPVGDADITGGPFDGNMYVCFTNVGPEDGTGHGDVDFIRSTDNGLTWSSRMAINDDANTAAIDNFHPWLVVNEDGVIIVVFYDQRYDSPAYYKFDLNAAYSFDGGLTFTANHRISTVSSSPDDLKRAAIARPWRDNGDGTMSPVYMNPMAGVLGEYIGVTAFHDKVNAVWTDSRHGNSEVYTANWYLPILEPRLIEPANGSLLSGPTVYRWSTAWKHNSDRYRVEIATDAGFLSMVFSGLTDTSVYTGAPVLGDGLYYWRVKAFTTDGLESSGYSPTWSFEVDATAPDAPTLLSPANMAVVFDPTPLFDWTTSTKLATPVTYDLYVGSDSLFPPDTTTRVYPDLTQSQYTPSDSLPLRTPAFWRVVAKDAAGHTATSMTNTVTYAICGNIDGLEGPGGPVDVADLTYLVAYLFVGGPVPPILAAANVDGVIGPSGPVDVADLTYLVAFLFQGGAPPVC